MFYSCVERRHGCAGPSSPSIKQSSYAETDQDRWLEDCCFYIFSIAYSSDRKGADRRVCVYVEGRGLGVCLRLIGSVVYVPPAVTWALAAGAQCAGASVTECQGRPSACHSQTALDHRICEGK